MSTAPWLCALEGLFARVCSHMLCHDVGFGEPLLTDLALERFVPRVRLDMTHGLLALSKPATLSITVDPLAHVLTLAHPNVVFTEMARERFKVRERKLAPTPETWVMIHELLLLLL